MASSKYPPAFVLDVFQLTSLLVPRYARRLSNTLVRVMGLHGGRDIEPSTSCSTIIISTIVKLSRSDPTINRI